MNEDKLKAFIVDDEAKAIKNLSALLGYFPFVELVGSSQHAAEARALLARQQIDLLLLDIQMPAETGFELLASIEERNFEVIFVTAYQEYALQAFKANAIDYLTKPIDIDDLENALDKVRKRMHKPTATNTQDSTFDQKLDQTLHAIATQGKMDKLMLPHLNGFKLIEIETIVSLEADGNYTVLHLNSLKKIVASKQLGQLEALLANPPFVRIHKSTLINLNFVEGYNSKNQEVQMKDGTQLIVARRKLEEFQSKLDSWVKKA
jgi:two-component system LytT family response regulator